MENDKPWQNAPFNLSFIICHLPFVISNSRGRGYRQRGGKAQDSRRSARAFSSDTITRRTSWAEIMPIDRADSSRTSRWYMLFFSIKIKHSSTLLSLVTVTRFVDMISRTFVHDGQRCSAATLSEM